MRPQVVWFQVGMVHRKVGPGKLRLCGSKAMATPVDDRPELMQSFKEKFPAILTIFREFSNLFSGLTFCDLSHLSFFKLIFSTKKIASPFDC